MINFWPKYKEEWFYCFLMGVTLVIEVATAVILFV